MTWSRISPRLRPAFAASVLTAALLGGGASAAQAVVSGPVVHLDTLANSTAAPGTQFEYVVELTNQGTQDTPSGVPFDVTVQLPPGVTADHVDQTFAPSGYNCDDGSGGPVAGSSFVRCTTSGANLPAGGQNTGGAGALHFFVNVDSAASGVITARFAAYGGGAVLPDGSACATDATPPPALPACDSVVDPTTIAASPLPFGLDAFDGQVAGDETGDPYTQAAGTPDSASTSFDITTQESTKLDEAFPFFPGAGVATPTESVKDVIVHLPPGLIGNPAGAAQCTAEQLTSDQQTAPSCPVDSQVGAVEVRNTNFGVNAGSLVPLYNMVPPPDVPARFGFNAAGTVVALDAHVRSGSDYGIDIASRDISQALPVAGAQVTLWGVPSDPAHDRLRECQDSFQLGCGSTAPRAAFLRLPTSCQGPLTTTVNVDSWAHPGAQTADGQPDVSDPSWKTSSFVSHNPPGYPSPPSDWGSPQGVTGCAQVPFAPQITVQPTSSAADSPTGLDVTLSLPQTANPDSLAEADLKRAVVELPEGMTVNASAANGLAACTLADVALHSDGPASCPDASKLGTVQIDTPLLSDPLTGSVYLAKQQDNPFGSLLALYIVASGHGVNIKLPGDIQTDPSTGRLTASFDDNPQLPFSQLTVHFFSGDRASLTTPSTCGTDTVQSQLSSWAEPNVPVSRTDSFQISSGPNGSPCPADAAHRPFAPGFAAGTTNPTAGAYSPFVLELTRQPGEQEITSLAATLPPGLLGKLAGISQCSDAALGSISSALGTAAGEVAAPSCPANSLLGYAHIGAGSGAPFYVNTGKVYLAGPYKGAPYSVAIVTPVVAGPFDLGNVVVRSALYIDPSDAHVTVVSDPIPTILQGIPLEIRDIRVVLNRPGFTVNPTSCNPMSIGGEAGSLDGATAPLSNRFQVGGCQELPFAPKVQLMLSGKGRTHSGTHPALTAVLTAGYSNEANVHSVRVALPLSLALDPNNSQQVCSYDVAQAVHGGAVGCPASTIIGTATAITPLLSQPLTAKVYLVQGIRFGKKGQRIRTLPSLLIPLRGQIAIDLRGNSSVNGAQQLVTTFSQVPDAFVQKFILQVYGGPKGILVITGRGRTICGSPQIANAHLVAQSGKTEDVNPVFSTPCGKPARLEHSAIARNTVRVTVHVPGAGKLTASGRWLRSQTRRLTQAQTVTVALHLTDAGVNRLHRKGPLQTSVTIGWTPAGGGAQSLQTRVLTIRR